MQATRFAAVGVTLVASGLAWLGQADADPPGDHALPAAVALNNGHFQLDPPPFGYTPPLGLGQAKSALAAADVFSEYVYEPATDIAFGLLTETSRGSYVLGVLVPASVSRPVWVMTLNDVPVPPPADATGSSSGDYVGDVAVTVDAVTGAFVSAVIEGH